MAAAYLYPVHAYSAPNPAYQAHKETKFQVALPGITYPMSLPGYKISGIIQCPLPQVNLIPQSFIPPSTQVYIQSSSSIPSIIPNREWLLDILKRYILTHHGIFIGNYAKYEIQKKDITDKFHKRIAELYPSDKYNITSDWLLSASSDPEFLPEYGSRLDSFPNTEELRIIINQADFETLAQDIADNIEHYFNIPVEFNMYDSVHKYILCFTNYFIPEGQRVVFFVEQRFTTNLVGIIIPTTEMTYQHDYITYDGKIFSVLDMYNKPKLGSITLFEIVNNIRNGVAIFMAHVEMDDCVKMFLTARDSIGENKIVKKEKLNPIFDKFIASRIKLDFYIKIWENANNESGKCVDIGASKVGINRCAICNVDIETGEVVCSTKCCRRTMHSSCLLELYCHEKTSNSDFRCDKCNFSRKDKYGRNTEMLMGLSGGFC